MSKATDLAKRLELLAATGLATSEDLEASTLLRQQEAVIRQCMEALQRVDAVERGMVTTKAHHYAARKETTAALAAAKDLLNQGEMK